MKERKKEVIAELSKLDWIEFDLMMKDRWTREDHDYYDEVVKRTAALKAELKQLEAAG